MLFAELHNKFDLEALKLERNEDILTSTVFGTLMLIDDRDVLTRWLAQAQGLKCLLPAPENVLYAFWPRLDGCIPDLLLSWDQYTVVVEAKYRSGPSDTEGDQERPGEQLVKQWDALVGLRSLEPLLSKEAGDRGDPVLLYVVDSNRDHKALGEFRGKRPDANAGLLFWQDLHAVLMTDMRRERRAVAPWKTHLCALLDRRNLGSYSGFSDAITSESRIGSRALRGWLRGGRGGDIRNSMALVDTARVIALNRFLKGGH